MFVPVVGWEKTTKAMEELGMISMTHRKVVATHSVHHMHWFLEGKPVVADKVIAEFSLVEKWQGMDSMNGHQVEIETLSKTAADTVRTLIADKLPPGSQLVPLALWMLEHTQSWVLSVHKHCNSELAKLMQM